MKTLLIFSILFFSVLDHVSAQWNLTGNTATDPSINFLGTTDKQPLVLRTFKQERMRILAGGKIGIGTKSPQAYLHLFGNMQIENNASQVNDEALLTLRSSATNGPTTNPHIGFKGEDELFAYIGYDFSTKDIVICAQPALYAPNLMVNHESGFTGINIKKPMYQLDVNGQARFWQNVGIGTSPGSSTLQVGSKVGASIGIGSSVRIADGGNNELAFFGSPRPWHDGAYSCGSESFRWSAVWAVDGVIQTSDARDKTNIRGLNYGLKEIMQLHPVKFNWKNDLAAGDKLGVVAQEIQKVLPEVVRDWEYQVDEVSGKKTKVTTEGLGVMYADIIPVLIRGMQEQQKEIEALKQQVQQLTENGSAIKQSVTNAGNFMLIQNAPNPFNKSTTISYNINTNCRTAEIIINDNAGKTVKAIPLKQTRTGTVTFDGSSLAAGTYFYSLMADGQVLGTKTMILGK